MCPLNIAGEGAESLTLAAQDFVGRRTAVLGASGYGKTNTVATLIEELSPYIPMTIIDPEGEMWSLRERIDLLIVGRSENVDIDIQPHQAGEIATFSVENGVSVVLDLFEYDDEEIEIVTQSYVQALWEACKRKKRPYHLVIEEADVFMPQPLPQKSIWKYVAKRGRKYGLGMIIASQRSQVVDKNILTQCQQAILHYVSHPRDLSIYKDLIPLPTKQVEAAVRNLGVGNAIIVEDGQLTQTKIRLRHTYHPGATPMLDGDAAHVPAMKGFNDETLKALRSALRRSEIQHVDPEVLKLQKHIRELQTAKEIADSLIEDMTIRVDTMKKREDWLIHQVDTLSKIKVEVQLVPFPVETAATVPAPVTVHKNGAGVLHQHSLIQVPPQTPQTDKRANELAQSRQRGALDRLVRSMRALDKRHQLIAHYLLSNSDLEMSLDDLTPTLGYSGQSLKSNPPAGLVRDGLRRRVGKRGDFRYASNLTGYAQQHFPDLPFDLVYERITHVLAGKRVA